MREGGGVQYKNRYKVCLFSINGDETSRKIVCTRGNLPGSCVDNQRRVLSGHCPVQGPEHHGCTHSQN